MSLYHELCLVCLSLNFSRLLWSLWLVSQVHVLITDARIDEWWQCLRLVRLVFYIIGVWLLVRQRLVEAEAACIIHRVIFEASSILDGCFLAIVQRLDSLRKLFLPLLL